MSSLWNEAIVRLISVSSWFLMVQKLYVNVYMCMHAQFIRSFIFICNAKLNERKLILIKKKFIRINYSQSHQVVIVHSLKIVPLFYPYIIIYIWFCSLEVCSRLDRSLFTISSTHWKIMRYRLWDVLVVIVFTGFSYAYYQKTRILTYAWKMDKMFWIQYVWQNWRFHYSEIIVDFILTNAWTGDGYWQSSNQTVGEIDRGSFGLLDQSHKDKLLPENPIANNVEFLCVNSPSPWFAAVFS